jgi:hypothetical protein
VRQAESAERELVAMCQVGLEFGSAQVEIVQIDHSFQDKYEEEEWIK